ncbi:hypothetical protein PFUGPA_02707 [Plasmodium falciparum Palo Alto/Uganda]|uniref:Uncharacterized protein n=1 Tax=Plasmodium falciparum (isolate Palo Alto / Uganda) TaxID=57270 RepID=W4IZ60_PLAFP|nr:hypothetical protein PFUGPA_02707 [Plasmodium falciparum Palo Alto/Uganda]
MNTSNLNYETWTFMLTTPNTSISFFIFHQNFNYRITPKTPSFLPNLSVMVHGSAICTYFDTTITNILTHTTHNHPLFIH